MVWGALIGAAVGLYSANKSSKEASKATDTSAAQNADALKFEQQRYDDWKSVFGDIQTNLKDYYMSRTPTGITTQHLEAFEKEKSRALESIRQNFEARGIATSGLAAAAESDVEIQSMQERARIRAEAPAKAAEEKLAFLTAGLGNDPSGTIMASKANRASALGQAAGVANAAKWETIGTATESVINAIEEIGSR